jgi:hypothetical protein
MFRGARTLKSLRLAPVSRTLSTTRCLRSELRPNSLDTFTEEENLLRESGTSAISLFAKTFLIDWSDSATIRNGFRWPKGPRYGRERDDGSSHHTGAI